MSYGKQATPAGLPEAGPRVRVPRRIDFAARDEANRVLGRTGGQWALGSEQRRLRDEGASGLFEKIDWVSERLGDGTGYDILSFDAGGAERFIEVETTNGARASSFLVSRNEVDFSREAGDRFPSLPRFPVPATAVALHPQWRPVAASAPRSDGLPGGVQADAGLAGAVFRRLTGRRCRTPWHRFCRGPMAGRTCAPARPPWEKVSVSCSHVLRDLGTSPWFVSSSRRSRAKRHMSAKVRPPLPTKKGSPWEPSSRHISRPWTGELELSWQR